MEARREPSDANPSPADTSPADTSPRGRGAILVLPTVASGQQGPVAAWVSAAGWASGLRRALGNVWIVTPDGPMTPDQLRSRASAKTLAAPGGSGWQQHIPVVVKTAVKDAREWRRAQSFRVDRAGPWRDHEVVCVWQRHELFHTAGTKLARTLGVPSVVFVPAPLIWQAGLWGVGRPGWSGWIERIGERDPLRAADVVACGSEDVAVELRRIGVDDRRLVITPTGADPELFRTAPDRDAVRRRLGLDGRFVVGWIGSFRRFHALEQAIEAVVGLDRTTLLLVGDGPERARIERLASERNVVVQCTGTVSHDTVPEYLAAMDVGLVLAANEQSFHYSPLKLAEYLSAGLPVVAPRAGALPSQLRDGVDAVLVRAGDRADLTAALRRLQGDPAARENLGRAARTAGAEGWSWDRSVERVLAAIPTDRPGQGPGTR